MIKYKFITYNLSKIFALAEKNLKLNLRFKYGIIINFITPILGVIIPIFIMAKFFEFNAQFGPWTEKNFTIYQIIAYNIILARKIIDEFPRQLQIEKYWRTFQALVIAPSNRFNLLLGIFLSEVILLSAPCIIFFIIGYIYYPISFFTVLAIIGIYLLISLIFSGIGIILGIFAVSNENILPILNFIVTLFFLFSCLTFPIQVFPNFVQNIINLNPFFYIIEILRLTWIENDIFISFTSHSFYFFIIIVSAIILPIIGIFVFNTIYKKYGIVGA